MKNGVKSSGIQFFQFEKKKLKVKNFGHGHYSLLLYSLTADSGLSLLVHFSMRCKLGQSLCFAIAMNTC